MDRNDQQAIQGLFDKLAAVERQALPRDAEAESFIRQQISAQPGAPYYMAQTIVVQEQALEAAQARIQELEAQAAAAPRGGGLFGGLFGGGQSARGSVPRVGAGRAAYGGGGGYNQQPGQGMSVQGMGAQGMAGRGGGGFLAGAAQTAMGVAGGVLLGNAIMGMFDGGGEAQAAEAPAEDPGADAGGFEDAGGFDDGGGFDDF